MEVGTQRKQRTVFWGNKRVTHSAIIAQARQETLQQIGGYKQVLLLQDTTSFNFSHHPATTGMGSLGSDAPQGFLAHSVLVASPTGVPLGLLDQQVWVRDPNEYGKRETRHERDFKDKESYKWVRALFSQDQLPDDVQPIVVADAEAHIYEFIASMKPKVESDKDGKELDLQQKQQKLTKPLDFIVRASDNRSFTIDGDGLFEVIGQQSAKHTFRLTVRRNPQREKPYLAQMEMRFCTVVLRQPSRAKTDHQTLEVWVVDVRELHPPDSEKAIHWMLLTSLPIETVEQAQQVVTWYSYRWLIERFHYTLKSGCRLEESQLRDVENIQRLLGVYSIVACRLLKIAYQSRVNPDEPCTSMLSDAEWQALYIFTQRSNKLPKDPPTLNQAVRWIGKLGGFPGRKGDGEPGIKVLWRGWMRLQDIVKTYSLLRSLGDVGNA